MEKYKIEIKWGLIFTITALIWIFIEKLLGWHDVLINKHAIYTNFFAIIAIAIYVFALLEKRKKFYDGKMTWQQGFISGLIITLIVVVLSPLAQYLTHEVITPNYFSNAINYAVESGNLTQEAAEKNFNLISYMIQASIGGAVMGVVTSAIVAIFVKKK